MLCNLKEPLKHEVELKHICMSLVCQLWQWGRSNEVKHQDIHDEDKEEIDKTGLLPLQSFLIKGRQIYKVDDFIGWLILVPHLIPVYLISLKWYTLYTEDYTTCTVIG